MALQRSRDGAHESAALHAQRRLFVVAGTVYFAWWFVVEAVLPTSYNPLPGRLFVVFCFFACLGMSFVNDVARRHLVLAFAACAWLLTAHYYYLVLRNDGAMPWAIGAYVVCVAVSACFGSQRSLLAYSLFSLSLALVVSLYDRALLQTIFLPGLVTMTLLSNFSLRNRRLLEEERAHRVRVDAARAAAEAGVVLRDEFILIASHELNTPLAALQLTVQGLTRVLRREEGPPSTEVIEVRLESCQRQITRLNRLVEALLDASRVSAEGLALRVEAVILVDVVRSVADMLAADAVRSKTPIEIIGESTVKGKWDRIRVEQIVMNLLRNALNFGSGKPIRLTVTEDDTWARLSVEDQGIGIAPEEQARIFGRFERAVSSKHYGGMGLGLYIARQLVEAHAGSIRVESEPGNGAKFIVELPRENA